MATVARFQMQNALLCYAWDLVRGELRETTTNSMHI